MAVQYNTACVVSLPFLFFTVDMLNQSPSAAHRKEVLIASVNGMNERQGVSVENMTLSTGLPLTLNELYSTLNAKVYLWVLCVASGELNKPLEIHENESKNV